MKVHQSINQDSGDVEYYTPENILNAARITLGGFDLDPASSEIANARVKATSYFTEAHNALIQAWRGAVWMNHPFNKKQNPLWIAKLVSEFSSGNCTEFCCITYASTSEKWFQPLFGFAQCYLSPRTNYLLPDGSVKHGVTKGSVVTYGGKNINLFANSFRNIGRIMIPHKTI